MKSISVTLCLASLAFSSLAHAKTLPEPSIAQVTNDKRQQLFQLNQEVSSLANNGNYRDALEKAQQAQSLAEKTCGKRSPEYAGTLQNLGNVYAGLGKMPDAVGLYQKAISILETLPGSEGRQIRLYKEIAAAHQANSNLLASQDSLRKAISLSERQTKLLNPEGIDLLFSYAATLEDLKKSKEAESFWARGLNVLDNIRGGHLDVVPLPVNAIRGRQQKAPYLTSELTASGVVAVNVTVDESGKVTEVSLISGRNELNPIALRMAKETTYSPLIHNGKPLKMSGVVVYRFPLEKVQKQNPFIRQQIFRGNP